MIIPSELQFTAERLMKSQGRTGTADNDINAIVSMGMIPQGYRVNNYLTDLMHSISLQTFQMV